MCQSCGTEYTEEEAEVSEDTGIQSCPVCHKRLRWTYELFLGKEFRVHRCPVSIIDYSTIFLVKLVNWSESIGLPPFEGSLCDQSNKYFEIRNIVVSERAAAEEELRPKESPQQQPQPRSLKGAPRRG